MQTTDLPLLLLVLGELMEHAAAGDRLYPSGWPLGKTGHVLGLHCLLAVCERFDDIDEDRCVARLGGSRLLPITILTSSLLPTARWDSFWSTSSSRAPASISRSMRT